MMFYIYSFLYFIPKNTHAYISYDLMLYFESENWHKQQWYDCGDKGKVYNRDASGSCLLSEI